MTKILFALNHKQTEDLIMSRLGEDYMAVGAVTYREAILNILPGLGAEILVFRDTLSGSLDVIRLFEQLRVEYPDLRIVFICGERPRGDSLLARVVSLGIYDIINKNSVPVSEIIDHIRHPALFRDVSQYRQAEDLSAGGSDPKCRDDAGSGEGKKKFGGLFGGLFRPKAPDQDSDSSPTEPVITATPEDLAAARKPLDFSLVRDTIREEAVRDAQRGLDGLIASAVEKETARQLEQVNALEEEVGSIRTAAEQKDQRIRDLLQQLSEEKAAREQAVLELKQVKEETGQSLATYEERLRAMQSNRDTPSWYEEQTRKWEARESDLNCQLFAVRTRNAELEDAQKTMEAERETMKASYEQMVQKLEEARVAGPDSAEAQEALEELRRENRSLKQRLLGTEQELRECQEKKEQLEQQAQERQEQRTRQDQESPKEEDPAPQPDYSSQALVLPSFPELESDPTAAPRTILALGTRPGCGNTTLALNLAAGLALQGRKTLLVECNDRFPLLNAFFELTNVPFGLHDALRFALEGDLKGVDQAIIRLRNRKTRSPSLTRLCQSLPRGLHLLVPSNVDLADTLAGNPQRIRGDALRALFQCLRRRQQYSHVILDLQPGDHALRDTLLESGLPIDRMILTLNQDPHSLACAGTLLDRLAEKRASELVSGALCAVSRFQEGAPMGLEAIARYLGLQPSRFLAIREDSAGCLRAMASGLPYVLTTATGAEDHKALLNRILPETPNPQSP